MILPFISIITITATVKLSASLHLVDVEHHPSPDLPSSHAPSPPICPFFLYITVILEFDLKLSATQTFSTASYTENVLYNILKVPRNPLGESMENESYISKLLSINVN